MATKVILRRRMVEARTGLRKSTIYLLMKKSQFPLPVRLSERAVGWLESDIEQWLDERTKVVNAGAME